MRNLILALVLALNTGSAAAQTFADAVDLYDRQEYAKAYRLFANSGLRQMGNGGGAYNRGVMLLHGQGVARNQDQGWLWIWNAAALGHPQASYIIARAAIAKAETDKELEAARHYLGKAADAGVGAAAYLHASLEGDAGMARLYYEKAAKQGHADAQFQLARSFHTGEVGTPDYQEAAQWYAYATDWGSSRAPAMLAALYAGSGPLPSIEAKARRFLDRAVAAGDLIALEFKMRLTAGEAMDAQWATSLEAELLRASARDPSRVLAEIRRQAIVPLTIERNDQVLIEQPNSGLLRQITQIALR